MKKLEKHKWYPLVKPTVIELAMANIWNKYVELLMFCRNDKEIKDVQDFFKTGMMNIALELKQEL